MENSRLKLLSIVAGSRAPVVVAAGASYAYDMRRAHGRLRNAAALPGPRLASITAPALIVHAKDDLLQLHHDAEYAAAMIPGAKLMSFEAGGNLVVVVPREAVQTSVRAHIREAR